MSGHTETAHAEMPLTGHNVGALAKDRLRSLVDRIERLIEEQKGLGGEIKDLYVEARSAGFDVRAMRRLMQIRRQDAAEVAQLELTLDTYRNALGMT